MSVDDWGGLWLKLETAAWDCKQVQPDRENKRNPALWHAFGEHLLSIAHAVHRCEYELNGNRDGVAEVAMREVLDAQHVLNFSVEEAQKELEALSVRIVRLSVDLDKIRKAVP